jgi:hypothetical protein
MSLILLSFIVAQGIDMETPMNNQIRWLRKRQMQSRYGEVCSRTIDRAVEDGRLPAPKYPFGNKVPYWDEDGLDQHDRNLAARMPQRASEQAKTVEAATSGIPKRRRQKSKAAAVEPAAAT